MRTSGQRIKEARKVLNKTQQEFGKLAGVTKAAVSQWERDITTPERDPLLSLQRNAKINPEWVTNQKGKMFNPGQSHGVNEKRAQYNQNEAELLKNYRKLSPDNKARLTAIIKALNQKLDKDTGS